MLQRGKKSLVYQAGVEGKRLFSNQAQLLEVDLPSNGELVQAEDINDDGKSDLIVRYDASDSTRKARSILVLLSP